MIYKIFLLAVVVVFVVDVSGVIGSVKNVLARWLDVPIRRLKPLDCSLCMVWWCGLGYCLVTSQISICSIAWVCMLSLLSSTLASAMLFLRGVLDHIIEQGWRAIGE